MNFFLKYTQNIHRFKIFDLHLFKTNFQMKMAMPIMKPINDKYWKEEPRKENNACTF